MHIFHHTICRTLKGAACSIFYTRYRDWPRLPSEPPNWDGASKKTNRENLKFGLKFNVWASITSMLVGISSPNFYWRRDELWSTNKEVIAPTLTYPKCSCTVSWRKSIRHVVFSGSFEPCEGVSNTITQLRFPGFCFFWNFTIGQTGSNMFCRISQNYKLLFRSKFLYG